ncbi:hypothetical protein GW17_00051628 [Ensete ventricosum]|uniref:Uncharacterized protein n=1 Tax=Ensete ventricosum TaxID=4639 RepID=A0A444CKT0_ENSVE|nr:hypothetical protein GW17_00051628 [Ensete ventricosum]RZR72254.1 hypothetical protein BHM03_00011759 [Ensete ventricosum]
MIDFARRRSISGDISRDREKEEKGEEKPRVTLWTISSPCAGRRNISPFGEKERDDHEYDRSGAGMVNLAQFDQSSVVQTPRMASSGTNAGIFGRPEVNPEANVTNPSEARSAQPQTFPKFRFFLLLEADADELAHTSGT